MQHVITVHLSVSHICVSCQNDISTKYTGNDQLTNVLKNFVDMYRYAYISIYKSKLRLSEVLQKFTIF